MEKIQIKTLTAPSTIISLFLFLTVLTFIPAQNALAAPYSQRLCNNPNVDCLVVQRGDTWESLWPDSGERHIAMQINRMNSPLYPGLKLAIPDEKNQQIARSELPFPQNIGVHSDRTIMVSPSSLAWAAYDTDGDMVRWGPVSTARGYCPDEGAKCNTPRGTFTIFDKQGEDCVSSRYPLPDGGAPMPYCMHFKGGFALHGGPNELPGFNASHGCVRMLVEDVQWLNQDFVTVGSTKVVVED